ASAPRPLLLPARPRPTRPNNGSCRGHALLDPLVPAEERAVLHTRYPAIRFCFVELARRAAGEPRKDDRLFTSHLTDLVTALLDATPSASTTRLLAQREEDGDDPEGGLATS